MMSTDQPPSQIGQSVGARIRAARQAKRYTQVQLAAPNFSVSYISAIERGHIQPSLRALEILAQRLGLSSTDLLPKQVKSEGNGTARRSIAINLETLIELELLEAQIAILQGEAEQAI